MNKISDNLGFVWFNSNEGIYVIFFLLRSIKNLHQRGKVGYLFIDYHEIPKQNLFDILSYIMSILPIRR